MTRRMKKLGTAVAVTVALASGFDGPFWLLSAPWGATYDQRWAIARLHSWCGFTRAGATEIRGFGRQPSSPSPRWWTTWTTLVGPTVSLPDFHSRSHSTAVLFWSSTASMLPSSPWGTRRGSVGNHEQVETVGLHPLAEPVGAARRRSALPGCSWSYFLRRKR